MKTATVLRPVWRRYESKWIANAVEHVRAGGHAVVVREPRWWLLLRENSDGGVAELTAWAVLDGRLGALGRVLRGPAKGCLRVNVPKASRGLIESWCERDSGIGSSVWPTEFECRECAMCCRKNHVVLAEEDLARWRDAGREELCDTGFTKIVRGRLTLRSKRNGDCVHLVANDCGIYALRPSNCAAFPMGSEGCLGAREAAGFSLGLPIIEG